MGVIVGLGADFWAFRRINRLSVDMQIIFDLRCVTRHEINVKQMRKIN
jgi:hypothetical protein